MSAALTPTPPEPPASPGPSRYTRWVDLWELILFFTIAAGLYIVVPFTATFVLFFLRRPQFPAVPAPELLRRIAEQAPQDVFFLVPVQLILNALLILLLVLFVRGRGRRLSATLAWQPLPAKWLLAAVVAGLLFAPAIQLLSGLIPPPERLLFDRLFTSKTAVWLILGMAVLIAPVVEELLFRGYIYALLERIGGTRLAVLLSGLLFGSIHFYQLSPGYFQMVLICVVGIVFSAVRARSGTVVAAIAVHFGYNLALSLFYLVSPHFRSLPP